MFAPRVVLNGLLMLLCALASPALAQSHTGQIAQIRVESVSQAPVCAATAPALPTGTWACIEAQRPHFQEMKELLFRAFESRALCTFEWSLVDSMTRRARIEALTCAIAGR